MRGEEYREMKSEEADGGAEFEDNAAERSESAEGKRLRVRQEGAFS